MAVAERFQRLATKLRLAREKRGETAVPTSGLILETFIDAAQKAMSGRFSSTDARKCLDRLMESTGSRAMASVGVGEFLMGWLGTRRLSVSPGTWKSYEEKVEGFQEPACLVKGLSAERTFWEKATILHAEYHRPAEKASRDRIPDQLPFDLGTFGKAICRDVQARWAHSFHRPGIFVLSRAAGRAVD